MYQSFFQNYRRSRHYYLHKYMTFLLKKRTEQDQQSVNDDSISVDKYNDDASRQESEMDTLNLDEGQQEDSDTDSQTASADENNENSNGKTKGKFKSVLSFDIEEALDKEAYEKHKRLTRQRACKRGLDPEIINELSEEYAEDKRPRRSLAERRKSLTEINEKLTPSYKADNKATKIKPNKPHLSPDLEEFKKESLKTFVSDNKTQSNKIEIKTMVDQSTSMNISWHNVGTQYEVVPDAKDLLDEMFLNSVKVQLAQMNGRQKLNFKSKVFRSLMEVFDDVNDFPQNPVIVKQHNKEPPPLLVNTTTGELRLMRELVSLVQAAKSTPEIVRAQDKVTPVCVNTTPEKSITTTNSDKTEGVNNNPTSSPTLEDGCDMEMNVTTDNLDDEEDMHLPNSLDETMVKTSGDHRDISKDISNVMGLPRHVLQKVVKVSGPSGSTIVARNGDKKRIYRIYPKNINPQDTRMLANKMPSSVGTFFVPPPKATLTPISQNLNKSSSSSSPNITVKNFANKSANVANAYPSPTSVVTTTQQNSSNNNNNNNAANKKANMPTLYKSIHPSNRILNASTGLFQTINSTSPSPSPSPPSSIGNNNNNNIGRINHTILNGTQRAKPGQSSMLPPISQAMSSFQPKKPMQVRSHINIPRRFSICGPLPAEKPSHMGMLTPKPSSNISNSAIMQTGTSQIQISKPVSLNKSAGNSSSSSSTPFNKSVEDADLKSPTKSSSTCSKPAENVTDAVREPSSIKESEEMAIMETAGTITADSLDPLYVKQTPIKSEPLDD